MCNFINDMFYLYQTDLFSNHWYFYLKLFIIQLVSFMKHLTFNDILFNIIIYVFLKIFVIKLQIIINVCKIFKIILIVIINNININIF